VACHIRKNDLVEVISGDHKGARGKVLRVDVEKRNVVVEGINLVYRHVRPSRRNPQGGRLQKELALDLSNVLPVDPKTGKPSRVRYQVVTDEHGHVTSKARMSTSGTLLGDMSKAAKEQR
jgi:large subunit ribosomal protein L24